MRCPDGPLVCFLVFCAVLVTGMSVNDWRRTLDAALDARFTPSILRNEEGNPVSVLGERLNAKGRPKGNSDFKAFQENADRVRRLLQPRPEDADYRFTSKSAEKAHAHINIGGILRLLRHVRDETAANTSPIITGSDIAAVEKLLLDGADIQGAMKMSWWRNLDDRELEMKCAKATSRSDSSVGHWIGECQAYKTQLAVSQTVQAQFDEGLCVGVPEPSRDAIVQPVFGVPQGDKSKMLFSWARLFLVLFPLGQS